MPPPIEITSVEWQRIVNVYVKHDGRIRTVAADLGWPLARTARLWRNGYPSLGYPPIKTVLARDAFSASEIRAERALIEKALPPSARINATAEVISAAESARIEIMVRREQERERTRADAIKSRAEEATLVSINRKNAIALNVMTAQVLRGASALSAKIQVELQAEADSGSMTVGQKLNLVRAAASIARFNSEASIMAVKAERMVLGNPIDTDGDAVVEDGGVDEAAAWIETAAKAIKRARARGLLAAGRQEH
jgi:hypothetical protein